MLKTSHAELKTYKARRMFILWFKKYPLTFTYPSRARVGPHEIFLSHESMGYFPLLEVIYVAWIFRIVSSSYSNITKHQDEKLDLQDKMIFDVQ